MKFTASKVLFPPVAPVAIAVAMIAGQTTATTPVAVTAPFPPQPRWAAG